MPGIFNVENPPKLPGAYVNFVGLEQPSVPPAIGSIVAVPFTHDWGPYATPVQIATFAEFQQVFGQTQNTPGYIAVKQAFLGEGTPGRGGAGAVICYRFGAATAAKATTTLQHSASADALTVTARYEGTKGNELSLTVQDHAADTDFSELLLLLGTTVVESYVYDDTDISDLVDQINTHSSWITATELVTGTALTLVTTRPLTGGNDGASLAAGDWSAMLTALEFVRFGVFAPFDLTDASIIASIKSWAVKLNNEGKRFMTVVGGVADESLTDATARARSLNDGNFITIGLGSLVDAQMLDAGNNPTVLSSAQFAPRLAGVVANRGEAMGLTYARFAGIDLLNGPTVQNIADAYDVGIITLAKDASQYPVRIAMSTTTYTTQTDIQKPVSIFREPKFMRTMQSFEMEITEYAEENVIGLLPVNDKTRLQLVGEMRQRLKRRSEANIVLPDYRVAVSPTPPPSDRDDFISLDYEIAFGRSINRVFNTIRVS